MLVEFLNNIIYVDKIPIAENIKLNIQPITHQLRLKITYLNGEVKTPIDIVIYNWSPQLNKLALSISIDGKELTTNTRFLLKLKYDIFKSQLKLMGRIGNEDIKSSITDIRDFVEIPKIIHQQILKTYGGN